MKFAHLKLYRNVFYCEEMGLYMNVSFIGFILVKEHGRVQNFHNPSDTLSALKIYIAVIFYLLLRDKMTPLPPHECMSSLITRIHYRLPYASPDTSTLVH